MSYYKDYVTDLNAQRDYKQMMSQVTRMSKACSAQNRIRSNEEHVEMLDKYSEVRDLMSSVEDSYHSWVRTLRQTVKVSATTERSDSKLDYVLRSFENANPLEVGELRTLTGEIREAAILVGYLFGKFQEKHN